MSALAERETTARRGRRRVAALATTALTVLALVSSLWSAVASPERASGDIAATPSPAALEPLPEFRPKAVEPEAGLQGGAPTGDATAEAEPVREPKPARSAVSRTRDIPYGSRQTDRPGWVQAGPNATKNPNATTAMTAAFEAASCVAETACADGRPIAVNTVDKRDDFLRGLMDDRVTELLLAITEGGVDGQAHKIVVDSARSTHPRYVQDRSGRRVDSNHVYGRAADIRMVDGHACTAETAGRSYRTRWDNPLPEDPGPCAQLAVAIAALAEVDGPTEVIFYWDAGGPSGVSLANHADHIHFGYNAF